MNIDFTDLNAIGLATVGDDRQYLEGATNEWASVAYITDPGDVHETGAAGIGGLGELAPISTPAPIRWWGTFGSWVSIRIRLMEQPLMLRRHVFPNRVYLPIAAKTTYG